MPESLKKIESELLSLSSQQRAFLADRLLSSLDGEEHLTETDAAWLAEVESRYEQYKKGLQKGIPAEVVFSEAKEITRK
ncbi:MAG: addiction module protein [Acidobacteria bacterium]|nr:MAG: addiction module protein [Acidobacteriota bacterium]